MNALDEIRHRAELVKALFCFVLSVALLFIVVVNPPSNLLAHPIRIYTLLSLTLILSIINVAVAYRNHRLMSGDQSSS